MASQVDIVNMGLTLLGEARIFSMDDAVKPAREAKAVWNIARDSLLAAHDWSFAMGRDSLSALSSAPVFQYSKEYQLPSDCLRVVQVAEHYIGPDLTDYRGYPTQEFKIEGGKILTDLGAPLPIRYIRRVEDTSIYAPVFVEMLAAKIAETLCEALTQSDSKRARAERTAQLALRKAVMTNAIEIPPEKVPDDEWVLSRR